MTGLNVFDIPMRATGDAHHATPTSNLTPKAQSSPKAENRIEARFELGVGKGTRTFRLAWQGGGLKRFLKALDG